MKPIFLFLSALFILHSLSLATGSLQESCKKASESSKVDIGFCVSSLQVDPNSRAADAKGLAGIAGKFTKANFTATKTKIDGLLRGKGPALAALRDCAEVFENEISDIDSATSRIQSGDISGALAAVTAVMSAPDDCDASFDETGEESPLLKETDNARKLASIFLSFTSFLKK